MKSLVAGWFSFDEVVATVGDLLARDALCRWLARPGSPTRVQCAPRRRRGRLARAVEPEGCDRVIFVCGPFGRRPLLEELVERFRGLSFAAPLQPALLVTAVLLAQPQAEYGGGLHGTAAEAIARLPDLRPTAPFHTDTDLIDADRIRGAGEATSLIARADAVVTTRLHGMVLSLRQGVPTVAIDPIPGGAKGDPPGRGPRLAGRSARGRAERRGPRQGLGLLPDRRDRERARECASARAGELGELERSFVAALAALP